MEEIPSDNFTEKRIKEILLSVKNIAVIGASRTSGKPAHFVPAYLKAKGYKIIPINPNATEILGEKVYKSILDIPKNIQIDIVDVFRPSEEVKKIVEDVIKKGIKIIWLQEGIYNREAIELAKKNNVEIIWNRCMMKMHKKLISKGI